MRTQATETSPSARWWKSPVERLVSSGDTGLARGALQFAVSFGVPAAGCFARGIQSDGWDRARIMVGLHPLPVQERATIAARNLALADAVIAVGGDPSAEVRKSGKHLLVIRIRDRNWPDAVGQFISRVRPAALLLAEADPASGSASDREQFAHTLLETVFALEDDRNPDDSLLPPGAVDAQLEMLKQRYPEQFVRPLRQFQPEPGWLPEIESLCAEVDRVLQDPELRRLFHWRQFKQKFGGLRAYYSEGPIYVDFICADSPYGIVPLSEVGSARYELQELIEPLVGKTNAACVRTCAVCGAPGELRKRVWWRTLCDLHARPGWPRRDAEWDPFP